MAKLNLLEPVVGVVTNDYGSWSQDTTGCTTKPTEASLSGASISEAVLVTIDMGTSGRLRQLFCKRGFLSYTRHKTQPRGKGFF